MDDDTQNDDLFNENEDASSDSGSDESGDAADDAPPQDTKAPKGSGNSDRRVNDLMSKWQSEQARNTQLQARIAELEGKQTSNGGEDKAAAAAAESNEFLELAREQARTALFGSDPRFAKYGFEVTAIEGKTASEMQASAKRLQAIVDKVETSAKSDALKEFGLAPEISSGSRDKPLDFASMSDKEILELGDRILGHL